jgi:predicted nucleic acid-binding protein
MIEMAKRVFLDTAPLIYFVQGDARYWGAVSSVFGRIDAGLMVAVTSPVTLAECLVLPYRKNHHDLVQEFVDRVVSSNMLFVPLNQEMACKAAEMRARYNLSLSDAFQAAVALATGCDAFLTNDADLKRIVELPVFLLDEVR